MTTFVSELEPRPLWRHFDRILATPRPSKHEEAMRAFVLDVARARNLGARTDKYGNVVVTVPASKGREKAPIVVLQSHLDMVCEKNAGVALDFAKDAIVPRREGDWLYATGTTLGSDNGIGVAAMLALAEALADALGALLARYHDERAAGGRRYRLTTLVHPVAAPAGAPAAPEAPR